MSGAYYNEIDPYCADWLRMLIIMGLIPEGEVDERDVRDVRPDDLRGFSQCHFFAGLGGWARALRLADWPDDRPAWTGSCPCQPFSAAGRGLGAADERHLWPHWHHLILVCHPAVVFGEQVAGKAGLGWLDGVLSDLEGSGYACGAAVVPACGVGAPHRRERLWFVADASGQRRDGREDATTRHDDRGPTPGRRQSPSRSELCGKGPLADCERHRWGARWPGDGGDDRRQPATTDHVGSLADSDSDGWAPYSERGTHGERDAEPRGPLGDADSARPQEPAGERGDARAEQPALERAGGGGDVGNPDSGGRVEAGCDGSRDREEAGSGPAGRRGGPGTGFWTDAEWIVGADGKARRVKPGVRLLAHGIPARVAKLRALGNAIVPQVAAEFVMAYREIIA